MTTTKLYMILVSMILIIFSLIMFLVFDRVDKIYVFLSDYDTTCEHYIE